MKHIILLATILAFQYTTLQAVEIEFKRDDGSLQKLIHNSSDDQKDEGSDYNLAYDFWPDDELFPTSILDNDSSDDNLEWKNDTISCNDIFPLYPLGYESLTSELRLSQYDLTALQFLEYAFTKSSYRYGLIFLGQLKLKPLSTDYVKAALKIISVFFDSCQNYEIGGIKITPSATKGKEEEEEEEEEKKEKENSFLDTIKHYMLFPFARWTGSTK